LFNFLVIKNNMHHSASDPQCRHHQQAPNDDDVDDDVDATHDSSVELLLITCNPGDDVRT
jgi:hypothetical protein